jgi:LAO/AO transport system kinase
MSAAQSVDTLAAELLAGSERGLSRSLTCIERGGPLAEALLERIYPRTGRAHVIGITGGPGSGKSTLTRALARAARERGRTVGIIAVDPSSPFSGGAILGDRIRMTDVATDSGVFIRSLATHGAVGGLSRAVASSIHLMDAAGKDIIFVETVGVGQDEIDVVRTAHTVIVVSVPGLGDDIQTLKAGLLEIADIHVVNKADRQGAEQLRSDLRTMLALGAADEATTPPILACIAIREEGVGLLLDAICDHMKFLKSSNEFEKRRRRILWAEVLEIAHHLVNEGTLQLKNDSSNVLELVLRREMTPHAAGRALLARLAHSQMREVQDV